METKASTIESVYHALSPTRSGARDGRPTSEGSSYRYKRFTTRLLMNDFRFRKGAPRAGDPFPNVELVKTDGERISSSDALAGRPLLLVFGSVSCPMTVGSIPSLKRLYEDYGQRVNFMTLYVREAHPGENVPQADSLQKKLDHARTLQQLEKIPWTVAVDDVDGTLHRALDTKPNAAYLVATDGTIVFRSLWAGDETGLRKALDAVAQGKAPKRSQSRAMFGPLMQGIGWFREVLRRRVSVARISRLCSRSGPSGHATGRRQHAPGRAGRRCAFRVHPRL